MPTDAAVLLGLPSASASAQPRLAAAAPLRLTVDVGGQARPVALHVTGAGLACCTVELVAAALRSDRARAAGALAEPERADADVDADAVPDAVDVLVVSGTLTDVLAPALVALHASLPAGTPVLSFGACSASGGPYWDSYSVTKGIGGLLPVDVYVPGCPPRPEALVDGLRLLPGLAR